MKHKTRAETDGIPLAEEMVYSPGARAKAGEGVVKLSIMAMIVHTDFKAPLGEPMPQVLGHGIRTFRYKVKGGAKTEGHFQFCQVLDASQTPPGLDIMAEDERETPMLWPTAPACRLLLRSRGQDGPNVRIFISLTLGKFLA
jgi:hypothetical protein